MSRYRQSSIFFSFLGFVVSFSGFAQTKKNGGEFLIYGKIEQLPDNPSATDTVLFRYTESGRQVEVKMPVKDSKFLLRVPRNAAGSAQFEINNNVVREPNGRLRSDYMGRYFMIEDSVDILIDKRSKKITLTGGRQNWALDFYMLERKKVEDKKDVLRTQIANKLIDSLTYNEEMALASAEFQKQEKEFIGSYPYAWQSLYVLDNAVKTYLNRRWANDPQEVELNAYKKMFFSLEPSVQEKGRDLLILLQNAENKAVPQFTGEMPDGKIFDLAGLKGKVFLVDFWGSWCRPCRHSHPHLKELYAKYKDKGFEIVGVGVEYGSRDQQWKNFKTAITEDILPWPQVLNDPDKLDLVKEYGVKGYPSKFLVGRDGRLVLRCTGSDQSLDARLKELFGY